MGLQINSAPRRERCVPIVRIHSYVNRIAVWCGQRVFDEPPDACRNMEQSPDLVCLVFCEPDASIVRVDCKVPRPAVQSRNRILFHHSGHYADPADPVPHEFCEPNKTLVVVVDRVVLIQSQVAQGNISGFSCRSVRSGQDELSERIVEYSVQQALPCPQETYSASMLFGKDHVAAVSGHIYSERRPYRVRGQGLLDNDRGDCTLQNDHSK